MELMNKFELAYELPDKINYLIPELLPKSAPDNFDWDEKDDLCFYYCYDYFFASRYNYPLYRAHASEHREKRKWICLSAGEKEQY